MMKAFTWPCFLKLLLIKSSYGGCWTEQQAQPQGAKILFLVLPVACWETLLKSIPSPSRMTPFLKPGSKNMLLKVFPSFKPHYI